MPHFQFQTYAWSIGTTSFRMSEFHRKVESQLVLLNDFWELPENRNASWCNTPETQVRYYDYIYDRGFITGELHAEDSNSRAKTAREKTSGLVDIGLIDENHRLTEVGLRLLNIAETGNFTSDNDFQIPSDSFIYLKQLLKTSCRVQGGFVRPFLVLGKVLQQCEGYLTEDEFTFLLPLCVDEDTTTNIIEKIHMLRSDNTSIENIIIDTVLQRENYQSALDYLIQSDKSRNDILLVGMNRKSPSYDEKYATLYSELKKIYIDHDATAFPNLKRATRASVLKNRPGTMWRALLFRNSGRVNSYEDLKETEFDNVTNEEQFASCFFKYMHLIKIRANLLDYKDLNRRYLGITDAFIFEDDQVKFAPLFENFFYTDAGRCFEDSFVNCTSLTSDISLVQINSALIFNDSAILQVFNERNNCHFTSMNQIFDHIETERYARLNDLIDRLFTDNHLIWAIERCENRDNDEQLISYFGGDADVPTIFEYVVGIVWYKLSNRQGQILDYMNLRTNNELLPETHAGGGESDIVYIYNETNDYPAHTLLIECTLMEGTTQRRGEMEPVSRHLSNYLIDIDDHAYCAFVANTLHASVISDFRARKSTPYYRNEEEHVDSMKIIPLHTRELKTIIENNIDYSQIYHIFDAAFNDSRYSAPPEWYSKCVKDEIDSV